MDALDAFARYEELRQRFPKARYPEKTRNINSLLDIADHADVFVFDAFGVLNVGETPIAGANERVEQLRDLGKKLFVLTNAASVDKDQAEQKFAKLGFSFKRDEIISSRDAGVNAVLAHKGVQNWGAITTAGHKTETFPVNHIILGDDPADYDAVDGFVFLGGALWTPARQNILESALRNNPRPFVVANPDLVAPREHGLSLEPGYFSHALWDATGVEPEFHGKPYPSVYELVMQACDGIVPSRIAMMGDTLHTDILGACAQGWQGVLVTDHGLFSGRNVTPFIEASGIVPHWQLGSI